MKLTTDELTERVLARLLDVLAAILIPLDVTPSRLAQISRAAFVKAEAKNARVRSSGRPHLARIAARTGLSRIEVKKIVSAGFSVGSLDPENLPRALRVLNAWNHSKGYTKGGHARALSVSGKHPSFESLCKRYSGDIPHQVILKELELRKLVKFKMSRKIVSVARLPARESAKLRDINALSFAASFLGELSNNQNVLVRRRERIVASSEIPNSYVENAIADRVSELLDNLPQLFAVKKLRRRKTAGCVSVYALVSRTPDLR